MPVIRSLFLPALLCAVGCAAPAAEHGSTPAASATHAAAAAPAAQPAATATATAAAKPKASDDMLVCRYERTIGSNIAEKVCRPKNQPQMSDDAAREWMRQQQSSQPQNVKPGGS